MRMDLLNGTPVCILKGDEFLPKEGMTFATQVVAFFNSQGGIANSPFGIVILDKKGVQNSKQHGNNRIKSASFAAVKDVLEKGIVIMPLDYYGTNNKKEMTGMVAAPIQIGEEIYVCVVEVISNLEKQRLYWVSGKILGIKSIEINKDLIPLHYEYARTISPSGSPQGDSRLF